MHIQVVRCGLLASESYVVDHVQVVGVGAAAPNDGGVATWCYVVSEFVCPVDAIRGIGRAGMPRRRPWTSLAHRSWSAVVVLGSMGYKASVCAAMQLECVRMKSERQL